MKSNLYPVITETSMREAKKNWFTFKTSVGVGKEQAKKQIEEQFKVNVLEVKTSTVKGKTKRSPKSRKITKGANWRKIFAKLKEGQKIDYFDQA